MSKRSPSLSRRRFLGAAAAAGGSLAGSVLASPRRRESDPVIALADAIRDHDRLGAFDVAAHALAGGATTDHVLSACLLAGVREVRPRHVGGKAHAMMMIGSLLDLTAGARASDARLLTLFAVDDFKRSQALDVAQNDDWKLVPRVAKGTVDAATARREFETAMDAWDDERADTALVELIPLVDPSTLFDVLRPYVMRCYVNIGHKAIYGALLERTLRDPRVGLVHAAPVLRNLVDGLLHDRGGKDVRSFERSSELAANLEKATNRGGAADPAASLTLLSRLRGRGWEESQDLVAEAVAAGASERTAFDSLRLRAAESFSQRPKEGPAREVKQLLPVHFVTTVNAFFSSSRRTGDSTLRAIALLQATAWLAQHAEDIPGIADYEPRGSPIDIEEEGEPRSKTLGEAFDARDESATRAALRSTPDPVSAMKETLVPRFASKCDEHHEVKYAAAALAEADAAHPSLRPLLLATAVTYLPGNREAEFEGALLAEEALRRAGISGD